MTILHLLLVEEDLFPWRIFLMIILYCLFVGEDLFPEEFLFYKCRSSSFIIHYVDRLGSNIFTFKKIYNSLLFSAAFIFVSLLSVFIGCVLFSGIYRCHHVNIWRKHKDRYLMLVSHVWTVTLFRKWKVTFFGEEFDNGNNSKWHPLFMYVDWISITSMLFIWSYFLLTWFNIGSLPTSCCGTVSPDISSHFLSLSG